MGAARRSLVAWLLMHRGLVDDWPIAHPQPPPPPPTTSSPSRGGVAGVPFALFHVQNVWEETTTKRRWVLRKAARAEKDA